MTHQHDDDLDDELPPHLRQLLHDGSEGPPMSAATSERLLGRVLVSVGAAAAATATVAAVTNVGGTGAATTAVATTATTTTAATTGLGVAMKAAIVAAVVGAAGVVGVVAVRQPASPISAIEVPVASPVLLPPSVPVVPAVPVEAAPVAVAPVEVAPVAPAEVAVPKPKPAPSSSMQPAPAVWELPMLEQARAALSSGRPEEALALVEDHQRRAPASPLLEESAAVRVMALSRAGRADEATTAAAAFVRRWPESLFGERVRRVLR